MQYGLDYSAGFHASCSGSRPEIYLWNNADGMKSIRRSKDKYRQHKLNHYYLKINKTLNNFLFDNSKTFSYKDDIREINMGNTTGRMISD